MPRRSPISSFEQPSAISSTTSRWRAVIAGIALFRVSYMMVVDATSACPTALLTKRRIFDALRDAAGYRASHEARLVPTIVCLAEPAVVERPDSQQELELVAEPCAHHLRPVGRDGERHVV